MGTPTRFGIFGLQPAYAPGRAVERVGSLPYGGPTDGSGYFPQGSLLGGVQVAAQSEVATLTIGGTPTGGTFIASWQGTNAVVYQTTALAFNVSLANFLAALIAAIPEWSGNVAVTGTPGSSYVVTFNTNLANQRIGGLFGVNISALTGGTPTGSWARTTRGSCGLNQYDLYSQGSNNHADAILKYDTYLSPGGSNNPPAGAASAFDSPNQPYQPTVYVTGIFAAAGVPNVDANAYTLGTLIKKDGGVNLELL
jgi:hypothetical protein